jgi:hypothetical protein
MVEARVMLLLLPLLPLLTAGASKVRVVAVRRWDGEGDPADSTVPSAVVKESDKRE